MKNLKKKLIGATTVASTVAAVAPLTSCVNNTTAPENKINNVDTITTEDHPITPIDNQWFGAELWYGGFKNHYATAREAFEFINSDFIKSYDDVTFILFEDWTADKLGNFTEDGCIRPHDRKNKNDKVTIDLNGFTINGNRRGNYAVDHGILELRKDGTFIVKNGTITGARTDGNGGAVFFDNNETTAILENLTISHNEATKNGGGVYIKQCDGSITLKNTTITHNKCSGYGGGVYMQTQGTSHLKVNLAGKILVDRNHTNQKWHGADNFTMQVKALVNDYEFEWENLKDLDVDNSFIRICNSACESSNQFVDDDGYHGDAEPWLKSLLKVFVSDAATLVVAYDFNGAQKGLTFLYD